jgi:hypothetical protein
MERSDASFLDMTASKKSPSSRRRFPVTKFLEASYSWSESWQGRLDTLADDLFMENKFNQPHPQPQPQSQPQPPSYKRQGQAQEPKLDKLVEVSTLWVKTTIALAAALWSYAGTLPRPARSIIVIVCLLYLYRHLVVFVCSAGLLVYFFQFHYPPQHGSASRTTPPRRSR